MLRCEAEQRVESGHAAPIGGLTADKRIYWRRSTVANLTISAYQICVAAFYFPSELRQHSVESGCSELQYIVG